MNGIFSLGSNRLRHCRPHDAIIEWEWTMKTVFASLVLTCAMLSAGAFASDNRGYLHQVQNVTDISKNQAWPLKSQLTVDPCSASRCLDV
jgi:hypothetical protein